MNSRLSYRNSSTRTTTTSINTKINENIHLISSKSFELKNSNKRIQRKNSKLRSFQSLKRNRRNSRIMSTRIIVMLITINISFCLFSMPMVINLKF